MAGKGLWRLELRTSIYRFAPVFLLLLATAALTVFAYDYVLKAVQGEIPDFVNIDPSTFNNYQFYIWSQWFGKNLFQFSALMAMLFGAVLVTGDKSRNTLQFVLSKPVSRGQVLGIKFIASYLAIALAAILSTIALYLMMLTIGRMVPLLWLFESTLLILVGLAFLQALGTFYSTVLSSSWKAIGATLLTSFVLTVPGYVGHPNLSLFYHIRGAGLLANHQFPFFPFLVIVVAAAGLYYLAQRKFFKLDI